MADELKSWKIEIVTSGGLTGKGDGGISVSSDSQVSASSKVRSCQDKLSPEELQAVEKLISRASLDKWRKSYTSPGNPHGYADQFLYQLKISVNKAGGSRTYETSWYDDTREKLPSDLDSLVKEVWKIRDRVVAKC